MIFILLADCMCIFIAFAQGDFAGQCPLKFGKWELIPEFSDEFNGSNLDETKWFPNNPTWQGRQPGFFSKENVKVKDGMLHLTAKAENLVNLPTGYHTFTTAAVQSKNRVRYGYFEIRCRPMNSAASSAFWFYAIDQKLWTEIDIFEIGGKAPDKENSYFTTVHVFKTPETGDNHWSDGEVWTAPYRLADEFHNYGFLWTKDELIWYVDGKEIRKRENTDWHQTLTLNFDSETMPEWFGLPDSNDLPSIFSIDYVRSWKQLDGDITTIDLAACSDPEPPAPYGALPTIDQLAWQQLEYYMFIHFGPNTFTNVEWGDGMEDPKVFHPTRLDCRQWAATAKAAGMKAIIITAKHHDGFCLWPSKYSTHTVRESLWKDGKGDVLKELSDACKEYGLKFGVYVSPWDRNHPTYGTPEYNQVFANTLNEVLFNYGEIFEMWFDGANGEGPNGKKQVYDFDLFHKTVHRHQPHAIISIIHSKVNGCRWIGNESGIAGETNWSTIHNGKGSSNLLNEGEEDGEDWVPGECDVSIRPGWFYSPSTDDNVKSLPQLLDIYYSSVGRNGALLLNVPPDSRGLIHANDSVRLMEFRRAIDESFAVNLAQNAKITADNTRGQSTKYDVKNLVDGKFDTYWATDDGQLSATLTIDFGKEQTFNRLMLQEYIPLGQRVKAFRVEYWNRDAWQSIDRQTTIGYKRILCFPMVTTKKLKVCIEESLACPVLNSIGVYKAPEIF